MIINDSIKNLLNKLIENLTILFNKPQKVMSSLSMEEESRLKVVKIIDYDNGIQIPYLKKLLDEQFTESTTKGFLRLQPQVRNLVKYLADVVPMTFKDGVVVETENESDQEIYSEILNENRFDNFCKTLDRMVFLCKTVFVKVSFRNESVYFDIITPQYVFVEYNAFDTSQIEKIIYPISIDVNSTIMSPKGIFGAWTKDNFYYIDERGTILNNPENPDNVNPYNIIPFIVFRERETHSNEFWQWPSDDIINAQDNLNVKLTFRNYLIKRFTIPVPVLKGGASIKGNQRVILDGSVPVVIDLNADQPNSGFEWQMPKADIPAVNSVIEEESRSILIMNGVDPTAFVFSRDKQSAEAISLLNAKLNERINVSRLSYQYSLEELLDVTKIVWNVNMTSQLSDDDVMIQIKDNEATTQSSTEKWVDYNNQLQLNLITAADIMLQERDDLSSRDEAIDIINQNAVENRRTRLSSLYTTPVKPTVEKPVVEDDTEDTAEEDTTEEQTT